MDSKEDAAMLDKCRLCNRELPIYFGQQEEIFKRLPERSLTKLLSDLKADMEAKVSYLQYLKISAKFIEPCSCVERLKVHTYCLTASIIREEKIYCAKCGDAYNLFIK